MVLWRGMGDAGCARDRTQRHAGRTAFLKHALGLGEQDGAQIAMMVGAAGARIFSVCH